MKNMALIILFLFTLVSSTSHASSVNDFCVADLEGPDSPSGYHCKPPNTVTIDDFVYRFNNKTRSDAFVTNVPGLNGLNLAALSAELPPGGVVSLHTHPGASEILIVIDGEVIAGFTKTNRAFVKKLVSRELIVFPKGLLHFIVNSSEKKSATLIATYSSSNPTFQFLTDNLFASDLSSDLISQTFPLDPSQVKKLKARWKQLG